MSVVNFPSKIPTPQGLELPQAKLIGLLHELSSELAKQKMALMGAENAGAFAAVKELTFNFPSAGS